MNFMPCIYIYIYTHTYIDRYCSRESDVSLLTAKWAGCWANTMPCCPSLTSTQYLGSETRGPWSPSSKPGSPTKPAAFLVLVPSAALTLHGMSASFILPTEGCTLDSPWVSISLLLKRLDKFDSSCHKKNMKMDASWGPWHSQQHVFRLSNIICICLCICICIYIYYMCGHGNRSEVSWNECGLSASVCHVPRQALVSTDLAVAFLISSLVLPSLQLARLLFFFL